MGFTTQNDEKIGQYYKLSELKFNKFYITFDGQIVYTPDHYGDGYDPGCLLMFSKSGSITLYNKFDDQIGGIVWPLVDAPSSMTVTIDNVA